MKSQGVEFFSGYNRESFPLSQEFGYFPPLLLLRTLLSEPLHRQLLISLCSRWRSTPQPPATSESLTGMLDPLAISQYPDCRIVAQSNEVPECLLAVSKASLEKPGRTKNKNCLGGFFYKEGLQKLMSQKFQGKQAGKKVKHIYRQHVGKT